MWGPALITTGEYVHEGGTKKALPLDPDGCLIMFLSVKGCEKPCSTHMWPSRHEESLEQAARMCQLLHKYVDLPRLTSEEP